MEFRILGPLEVLDEGRSLPLGGRKERTLLAALLVNSNTALDEVRRNVQTATPVHMIYHGFEPFRGTITTEREPIVLSVGNISEESMQRKGHQVFADTAALVPEAQFVLVGRSLDTAGERVRATAPPNLQLPGFLSQAALDDLLSRASVYVQASAHEGFGCSVAEAMAAGCPVVATDVGGVGEVIADSSVGFLVPPRKVDELGAAIRRVLTDLAGRQAMGAAARARVTATFDVQRCYGATIALYAAQLRAQRPERRRD